MSYAPATAKNLQDVLHLLPAKDVDFAKSLISARRPTDKQAYWINRLFERAVGAECQPQRQTAAVGDMAGVIAMFDRIRKTPLKHPAIVLHVEDFGDVRINVASARAQVPGSLNVVGVDGGEWFGRIRCEGVFEASFRHEAPRRLTSVLQAFAADPLKIAAEHGRLTGRCCFCNHGLKDPKSVERGYGPVCAKAWVGK